MNKGQPERAPPMSDADARIQLYVISPPAPLLQGEGVGGLRLSYKKIERG